MFTMKENWRKRAHVQNLHIWVTPPLGSNSTPHHHSLAPNLVNYYCMNNIECAFFAHSTTMWYTFLVPAWRMQARNSSPTSKCKKHQQLTYSTTSDNPILVMMILNTNICLSRQKNSSCRLFVAHHAIRRNKLKKKTAFYLETAQNPFTFASDFWFMSALILVWVSCLLFPFWLYSFWVIVSNENKYGARSDCEPRLLYYITTAN